MTPFLFLAHMAGLLASPPPAIVVASKPFGESYLLAEMVSQLLEAHRIAVVRKPGLGATEVAFGALESGAIDVYPEYTGTGLRVILHDSLADSLTSDARGVFTRVSTAFARRYGMRWLPPLGFENTYAIAVRRETAERLQLRTLTDLAHAGPMLTAGFTADFIGRPDGLPGLRRAYGLRLRDVRPLAPAIKYRALAAGSVDVIDGYSTDGRLADTSLVTLADDRHFFPPYEAALLIGPRLAAGRADVLTVLSQLSGRISVQQMRRWNREVELDGLSVRDVARRALSELGLATLAPPAATAAGQGSKGFWRYLWDRRSATARETARHLMLVMVALMAAVAVALPIGLGLERTRRGAEPVIGALGVLETIPSIALLAFMIPLLGVGIGPALVALWLYALYPIARNTYAGVRGADPDAVEAAEALGMNGRQVLLQVRLPLAAPTILSGVRTAAVITVGAATLAAFIGAGGLGEPIVAGLALADNRMVLAGALPAALLALAVDGVLGLLEHMVTPAHLKRSASSE